MPDMRAEGLTLTTKNESYADSIMRQVFGEGKTAQCIHYGLWTVGQSVDLAECYGKNRKAITPDTWRIKPEPLVVWGLTNDSGMFWAKASEAVARFETHKSYNTDYLARRVYSEDGRTSIIEIVE